MAALPEPVLKELAEEMMDYQVVSTSVMEMNKPEAPNFQKIIDEAEQDLRDSMNIPVNYIAAFCRGGTQQFCTPPV